ncbi:hypothetical protein JQ631_24010 [Bradyrhizobium manausense]|uniref:hypothetical protein n=1 Tax=Bradyrhizobium manausense TaxID=989370 RepID=UPI001BA488F2|nr:hypothetical protein [Bradyrhizobium manausense]MBR0792161.1 hypothetical protein [Bradyrhizobium manausense]
MWATIIIAVVKAAAEFYEKEQDIQWKNSVSGKLNEIISKLAEIDAFLHLIPGIFVTLLDAEQRKIWATQIRSAVEDANDLMATSPRGPRSDSERRRWETHFDHIKTLVEDNMDFENWGFEQFAIVAVGISAAAGLAKFNHNKKLFKDFVKTAIEYYASAIDPKTKASFANALETLTADQNALVADISPLFERVWYSGIGDAIDPPSGHGHTTKFIQHYLCHGSIQTGVTGVDHSTASRAGDFMPGTAGPDAEEQGIRLLNNSAQTFASRNKQIESARNCIEVCTSIIATLRTM